jgi:hypothetical protein
LPNGLIGLKFTDDFPELSLVDRRKFDELDEKSTPPKQFSISMSTIIIFLILPESGISNFKVSRVLNNLQLLRLGMTKNTSYPEMYFPETIEAVTASHTLPSSTDILEFEIISDFMYNHCTFTENFSIDFSSTLNILRLGKGFHFPSLDLTGLKLLKEVVIGDDFFGRIKYPPNVETLKMGKKYFGYSQDSLVYYGDQFYRETEEEWLQKTDFRRKLPKLAIVIAKNPLFEKIGKEMTMSSKMPDLKYVEVNDKVLLDRSRPNRNINKN